MADDHYDVLGVRPGATLVEIELAFKGRRSQYHPDRYAAMDAATIAWATTRMQEVNGAYRILSDPDSRRAYDSMRQHGSEGRGAENRGDDQRTQSTGQAAEPPAQARSRPLIADYLAEIVLERADAMRFHVGPDIPAKKLATALSCRQFAQSAPPSSVHLLIDDTVFEGGAEGLLITDEYLSFKSLFEASDDVMYERPWGWRGDLRADRGHLRLLGPSRIAFNIFSPSGVQKLAWAINAYFADRRQWRLKLAKAGDVESQFFLSGSFEDKETTQHWLVQAAEAGHVTAQHNLGVSLIPVDLERAYGWLTKAAQQGSTPARERLSSDNRFARFRSAEP